MKQRRKHPVSEGPSQLAFFFFLFMNRVEILPDDEEPPAPPSSSSSSFRCRVCGTSEKLQRCGRCRLVCYCSTQHQRADWPSHKEVCRDPVDEASVGLALSQELLKGDVKSVNMLVMLPNEVLQVTSLVTCMYSRFVLLMGVFFFFFLRQGSNADQRRSDFHSG